ncbi:site-2 protease family protein [Hoyosella rhizosphaerae]|nr:site-2 protease family protein [Hoyosella rhizosphaerae]MBN4927167.1 site-2 protease family protein [Hoyosella rhizosphaerae]
MERGRIRLGTVAGIPVGAHWSVLAIFGLITIILGASILPGAVPGRSPIAYWFVAGAGSVIFLGSLLVHELAHALVALKYGVGVRRITLWLLGGVAELTENPRTPKSDFRIAVVGPLASLAIAVVALIAAYVAHPWIDTLLVAMLIWISLVNLIIAVFNMLPGAPLDGGRVLRAFLWKRTGDRERASEMAATAGRFLGFIFIGLGIMRMGFGQFGGLWLLLIGGFMLMAAHAESEATKLRRRLAGVRVSDVMSRRFDVAPAWWPVEQVLANTTTGHRVVPVVSATGTPVGVVNIADLARLDPHVRMRATIADVSRPLPADAIVGVADELVDVLNRIEDVDAIFVVDRGAVVGVLTSEQLFGRPGL